MCNPTTLRTASSLLLSRSRFASSSFSKTSPLTTTTSFVPRSINATTKNNTASNFLTRNFSSTTAIMVKAGDAIPSVELFEDSPGNKVKLSELLKDGKGMIIGVPAAFSPGCSETHVPGYIASDKLKSAGHVFVVSVNDAFVMKAWGKDLDADKSSGIRFLADATGEFTGELDLLFDATPILGNKRSKRYAIVTEDGKVKSVHVEPDNTGIDASSVEKVLGI